MRQILAHKILANRKIVYLDGIEGMPDQNLAAAAHGAGQKFGNEWAMNVMGLFKAGDFHCGGRDSGRYLSETGVGIVCRGGNVDPLESLLPFGRLGVRQLRRCFG